MNIGIRIQELRKSNHMTARTLAEKINISPSFISAIENDTTKLSLKTLTHICEALGVSLSDFFNTKLSPTDQKLITVIMRLPEQKKYQLLQFLTGLDER